MAIFTFVFDTLRAHTGQIDRQNTVMDRLQYTIKVKGKGITHIAPQVANAAAAALYVTDRAGE